MEILEIRKILKEKADKKVPVLNDIVKKIKEPDFDLAKKRIEKICQ